MPQTPERKRQYARERREKLRDRLNQKSAEWRLQNRDQVNERNRQRRLSKRAMCLVAAARIRSRNKGIPFSLNELDVCLLQQAIDTGLCQLSGIPFNLERGRCATSPSLDRIDPKLGYISGNVRVVCHAINAALGDWGVEETLRIMREFVRLRS